MKLTNEVIKEVLKLENHYFKNSNKAVQFEFFSSVFESIQ